MLKSLYICLICISLMSISVIFLASHAVARDELFEVVLHSFRGLEETIIFSDSWAKKKAKVLGKII